MRLETKTTDEPVRTNPIKIKEDPELYEMVAEFVTNAAKNLKNDFLIVIPLETYYRHDLISPKDFYDRAIY